MADQAVTEGGPKPAPVVIKKYANRRLYNTATSAYVTLDHLSGGRFVLGIGAAIG